MQSENIKKNVGETMRKREAIQALHDGFKVRQCSWMLGSYIVEVDGIIYNEIGVPTTLEVFDAYPENWPWQIYVRNQTLDDIPEEGNEIGRRMCK